MQPLLIELLEFLPELGSASIFAGMKAISMMRSIPKALEDNTFVNSA